MAATTPLSSPPKSAFSIVSALLSLYPKTPEPRPATAISPSTTISSSPTTGQITFQRLTNGSYSLAYSDLALPPTSADQWTAFCRLKNVQVYSSRNVLTDLFPEAFLQTLDHIENAPLKIPALQKHLDGPVLGWMPGYPKKNIITSLAQDVIHGQTKLEVLENALQLGANPSNAKGNEFFPGADEPLKVILLQYASGFTNPQGDEGIKLRYRKVIALFLRHNAACCVSEGQKDVLLTKAFPT